MSQDPRLKHDSYATNPWLAIWKAGYIAYAHNVNVATALASRAAPGHKRIIELIGAHAKAGSSPANFLLGNPAAWDKAVSTRGQSLVDGVANFARDLLTNEGKPTLSNNSSFAAGKNMAVTPGVVIYRGKLFELIRYEPTTAKVNKVPLLIVGPPINKYYILDLAHDRSFVQAAVQNGHTVFAMSWVNPDKSMAEVSFNDYVTEGVSEALGVIPGAKVNLLGLCLGGTLATMAAAYDTASGTNKVNSLTLIVTLTDFSGDTGAMGEMITKKAVKSIRAKSAKVGFLSAKIMGGGFTNLNPAGLIWGPASQSWLLGEAPPAIEMLAWNADGTRLPSRMHAEYLTACYVDNDFTMGRMVINGVYISPEDIVVPVYAVAGDEDYIVPWFTAISGASRLGRNRRMVRARGAHIGVIIPSPKRASFLVGADTCTNADEWLLTTTEHEGSWWVDWANWLKPHSGNLVDPPMTGKNLGAAPGTYVLVK